MTKELLINLSMLMSKPTGISIYADSIFPYLKKLNPILLRSNNDCNFNYYLVPNNLTPEQGTAGHFRRLLWTQFKLPKIYQKLEGSLLFSPVPEAPLYTNCRSIVMVHDLIPLRFPKKNSPLTPYFKTYIPQVLKQAKHILCNSQATATDIINFFGISANKITPILLAYNSNHFRPIKLTKKIECRTKLPYFLYLGRHDLHKNLSRLIKAFAGIKNYQNYELWLAGQIDQRYTPKLKQQATEWGVINQIKFLNYVSYDQLPILLNQALALVFPSLWEGFGFPVLEAMGCGTPVITSNLSSLPEITGDAGLLIDPYQISEITDAMEQIINDNKLRSKLKTLSLKQSSQFSWQKTGHSTLEILKRFL
ncbi:glycosyltransferase family 4 protein [Cyanobacterium sp. uoEpiScrs1]|uniref:glycosyltransferase family 4 protein n=1 Tax=Cyanobacterium sp. uoEpiScrs1 TaxID=2976343 RepID=UPI0022698BFE|nr:glycosyltransferase family 1 protein [Cyanobacterium sp. uoEpiScrs1]